VLDQFAAGLHEVWVGCGTLVHGLPVFFVEVSGGCGWRRWYIEI
jgi:hypothetical protein